MVGGGSGTNPQEIWDVQGGFLAFGFSPLGPLALTVAGK